MNKDISLNSTAHNTHDITDIYKSEGSITTYINGLFSLKKGQVNSIRVVQSFSNDNIKSLNPTLMEDVSGIVSSLFTSNTNKTRKDLINQILSLLFSYRRVCKSKTRNEHCNALFMRPVFALNIALSNTGGNGEKQLKKLCIEAEVYISTILNNIENKKNIMTMNEMEFMDFFLKKVIGPAANFYRTSIKVYNIVSKTTNNELTDAFNQIIVIFSEKKKGEAEIKEKREERDTIKEAVKTVSIPGLETVANLIFEKQEIKNLQTHVENLENFLVEFKKLKNKSNDLMYDYLHKPLANSSNS